MALKINSHIQVESDFHIVTTENYIFEIGFGNKDLSIDALKDKYPNADFFFLKQVHGTEIIPCDKKILEADGHFSETDNQILTISTADCMPIMLLNSQSGRFCALHAGWRGLFAGIVKKAMELPQLAPIENLHLFVGPHIGKESFEVQPDIFPTIHRALEHLTHVSFEEIVNKVDGQNHVDLMKYLEFDSFKLGLPKENLHASKLNTCTDPHFHSFRRDGSSSGRQISYIQRKPKLKATV